jgi:hypothetical protein
MRDAIAWCCQREACEFAGRPRCASRLR